MWLPKTILLVTLTTATASLLQAQTAKVTYYGKTCAFPEPLSVVGLPRLGTTFQVEAYSSHRIKDSTGMRWLVFGLSDARLGSMALPIEFKHLFAAPFDCGYLLNSAELMLPQPKVRGIPILTRTPFAVPNQASWLGFTIHVQVFAAFTVFGPNTRASSRGARLVVGR